MWVGKHYRAPRIVQPGRPWYRRGFLLALVLSCLVLALWYTFERGRVSAGYHRQQSEQQITLLEHEIDRLEHERSELRRKVAVLERSAQIDRIAVSKIKEQLQAFQQRRLEQDKELAFLRGIVSSGGKREGLRIQEFRLDPSGNALTFQYRFTVSQLLKNVGWAKGRIWITIDGTEAGKTKSLTLQEVTADRLANIKMRFRYFQKVEGKIRLPKGFAPVRFNVEVKSGNGKLASVKKSFDWKVEG